MNAVLSTCTRTMGLVCAVGFALSVSAAELAEPIPATPETVCEGSLTNHVYGFDVDFTVPNPPARLVYLFPLKADFSRASSVEFDFSCADLETFTHFSVYLKSGKGWYAATLSPNLEGRTERVRMSVSAFDGIEGKPAGLDKVTHVQFAGWRGAVGKSRVTFGNFRVNDAAACEAIVLRGDSVVEKAKNRESAKHGIGLRSKWMTSAMEMLGVSVAQVSDLAFSPDCLTRARLVVLPQNVVLPENVVAIIRDWLARGGRLLVCSFPPKAFDMSALEKAGQAVCVPHVWQSTSDIVQREEYRKVLGTLVPDWQTRFAEATAADRARVLQMAARVQAMPPRAGERRLAWCHSERGLGGTNTWDSSIRFLKACGFTDILANLSCGATAYYKSSVLARAADYDGSWDALDECLAACRKYGVRLHVWRVNYNTRGKRLPEELMKKLYAEGRLSDFMNGKKGLKRYLCPSDPRNLQQEIDAMVELAERGVDGVHYDHIRYPGGPCCYCDGCRGRFEAKLGRKVENWPKDLTGSLAAEWEDFRAGNISALVGGVAKRLRATYPKVEISAAVMREAISARRGLGQDWGRWCREGWLDFLCPMNYTESALQFRSCVQNQKVQAAGVKLYPGVGLSCWQEDGLDAERFADQIEIVRNLDVPGLTVFNFDRRAESLFPLLARGPFRHE